MSLANPQIGTFGVDLTIVLKTTSE